MPVEAYVILYLRLLSGACGGRRITSRSPLTMHSIPAALTSFVADCEGKMSLGEHLVVWNTLGTVCEMASVESKPLNTSVSSVDTYHISISCRCDWRKSLFSFEGACVGCVLILTHGHSGTKVSPSLHLRVGLLIGAASYSVSASSTTYARRYSYRDGNGHPVSMGLL